MHALDECECYFTPARFLDLLEPEQHWIEHLVLQMRARDRLGNSRPSRPLVRALSNQAIAIIIEQRAKALRNRVGQQSDSSRQPRARPRSPHHALRSERVQF